MIYRRTCRSRLDVVMQLVLIILNFDAWKDFSRISRRRIGRKLLLTAAYPYYVVGASPVGNHLDVIGCQSPTFKVLLNK